jgi:hypothetical protein
MKPDWPACFAAFVAIFAGGLSFIAISFTKAPSWIAYALFVGIATLVLIGSPSRQRVKTRHILVASVALSGTVALLLYVGLANYSSPLAPSLTRPALVLLHGSQIGDAWFPIVVGILMIAVLMLSVAARGLSRLCILMLKRERPDE